MILKNKNIVTGKQSYIFVVVCSNSTTTLLVKLWFCRKERLIVGLLSHSRVNSEIIPPYSPMYQ